MPDAPKRGTLFQLRPAQPALLQLAWAAFSFPLDFRASSASLVTRNRRCRTLIVPRLTSRSLPVGGRRCSARRGRRWPRSRRRPAVLITRSCPCGSPTPRSAPPPWPAWLVPVWARRSAKTLCVSPSAAPAKSSPERPFEGELNFVYLYISTPERILDNVELENGAAMRDTTSHGTLRMRAVLEKTAIRAILRPRSKYSATPKSSYGKIS